MTQEPPAPVPAPLPALALDSRGRLVVGEMLDAAREFLDMEAAYLARIDQAGFTFLEISGDAQSFHFAIDFSWPRAEMYCGRMIGGELPNVVADTTAHPRTAEMEITRNSQIGSYVGVPLKFSDGTVYGSLACVSHAPDPALGKREVRFMQTLARFISERLEDEERAKADIRERSRQLDAVLDEDRLAIYLQPIVGLLSGEIMGYEALSRFNIEPYQSPDVWFRTAAEAGRGTELELAAVRVALERIDELPDSRYLSINVSPQTLLSREFSDLVGDAGTDRLVVEITEHAAISDYPQFNGVMSRLRFKGLRYAVDDAGAGFASFSHILSSKPDIVKLDISLIRDVHRDLARRALIHGLMYFIEQMNATAVAEGVEVLAEAEALMRLGVHAAQGYYFGKPSAEVAEATTKAVSA